jgi:hypothetical protein
MSNPTLPSPTPTAQTGFQNPPTLAQIQQKVRRLTRSPSTQQLADQDLNNYINTFVLYDFPEHLRTFNLQSTFTFYTNPGQDVYNTDEASFAGAINNPLYNFQNLYLSVSDPVYIGGYQQIYLQSRAQFYGIYPLLNSLSQVGSGNGTTGPFSGVVNSMQAFIPSNNFTQQISLLQNNVTFSSYATLGNGAIIGQTLVDVPLVDPTSGFKLNIGNLYDPNTAEYETALRNPPTLLYPVDPNALGFINYLTGQFTLNFTDATTFGTPINAQTVPQQLAIPQALLFYANQFIVRPVPDQAYPVNIEVFQRPTALLATNQAPELEEYWQYIAYGAAKKIFEDRMDTDSVQKIMPEYVVQEALCLRRTIVQNTTQRTATIYEQQTQFNNAWSNGWGFGGPY